MLKKIFSEVAKAYNQVQEWGENFAQGAFSRTAQRYMKKDLPENDKKTFAGVAAIAAGGLGKTATWVGIGLTALGALTNPVTLGALASYAVFGVLATASLAFSRGMENGGDKDSGILTMRDGFRQGMVEMVAADVKGWAKRTFGGDFKKAAARKTETTATPAPANDAAPKVELPKVTQIPTPKN